MQSAKGIAMAPVNIKINPIGGAICAALALCIFLYIFGVPSWFLKSEPRISMRELLSASIELAERGGDKVREIRKANTLAETEKGKTKEGAAEMLTQGDLESHRAILYGFAKAFPELKVVSEEHEKQPVNFRIIEDVKKELPEVTKVIDSDQSIKMKEITVWIDPLDATQEYTENLIQYVTTMVCVAVNGQPTIGVIHKPFANDNKGETTWAWVGYGHSENLKKAEDRAAQEEDIHKIIVSRSHAGAVDPVAKSALGEKTEITPAGGAGYKTLEVINGKADAYVHVTLIKKWDICAGNAILSAIGGKMTTLDGHYIDYSEGDKPKNEGGLLATTYHHDFYREKLKPAADEMKKKEAATKHRR